MPLPKSMEKIRTLQLKETIKIVYITDNVENCEILLQRLQLQNPVKHTVKYIILS